jgi:hypothetical protein
LMVLGWWANDVRQHRTHSVIVEAATLKTRNSP